MNKETYKTELNTSEEAQAYRTFFDALRKGNGNDIRHSKINSFICEFDKPRQSPFKKYISKESESIKDQLDKMYLKGDADQLNEIKHDLLEEMFLSFSRLHLAIGSITDIYPEDSLKRKDINRLFRYNNFKQLYIRSLINHIDKYRFLAVLAPISKAPNEIVSDSTIMIEDIVKSENALKTIYQILIKAELIDGDTKIFIDKAKGGKGFFYSTLTTFRDKGYFKREPTIQEYLDICLNSFSIKISDGTARNKKALPKTTITIPSFTELD